MEFKGTKGEWEVIHEINVTSKNRRPICACGTTDFREKDSMKVNKANAKLIAAAPELLEALISVLKLQKDNYGNGMNTHMRLKALCDTKVKQAIEKALK